MPEQSIDEVALEALEGALGEALAPPRRNGELVFDAPWQSRAFAMATLLQQQGHVRWNEFAARMSAGEDVDFYHRWLAALTDLLSADGVLSATEIEVRAADLAAEDNHGHTH